MGDAYRQEYYAGQAEDIAEVADIAQSAMVPAGDFSDVLVVSVLVVAGMLLGWLAPRRGRQAGRG